MSPDVNTLIMKHKQTLEDADSCFKIDAVPIRYLVIVLHEVWRHLERTDKVLLFASLLIHRLLLGRGR